ncbi:putative tRNA pseudouridine synthase Pus10 [Phlyctochytrium bullatum]|nr:putative tRNA pseudouridine synthase Pus10 [Phlyctochytrium bullatum]
MASQHPAAALLQRLLSPTLPDVLKSLPPRADAVASCLWDLDCCHSCILRFLGIKQRPAMIEAAKLMPVDRPHFFNGTLQPGPAPPPFVPVKMRKTADANGAAVTSAVPVPSQPPEPGVHCPACLGILHSSHDGLVDILRTRFLALPGHDRIRTFLVSCRVPVHVATRTRALHLCLEHRLKELGIEYVPPQPTKRRNERRTAPEDGAGSEEEANGDRDEGGEPMAEDVSKKRRRESSLATSSPAAASGDVNPNRFVADDTVDVKDVLRGILIDSFEKASGLQFDTISPFQIEVGFDHLDTDGEYAFMLDVPAAMFKVKKKRKGGKIKGVILEGASWEGISKAAARLSYADFDAHNQIPPPATKTPCTATDLQIIHQAVFVAGRYRKIARGVSNSRWEIDGQRLAEHSVEELVCLPVVERLAGAGGHKFSSAGREDADVLMLGEGRPFYCEVLNPGIPSLERDEVKEVERKINEAAKGLVEVSRLQVVTRESTSVMKDSASTKKKTYTTLVRLSSPVTEEDCARISAMIDLQLKQQTPLPLSVTSTSSRRSDLIRDKTIHNIRVTFERDHSLIPAPSAKPSVAPSTAPSSPPRVGSGPLVPNTLLRVDLTTSAGTYVKEFVHGDGGRTVPSLKEMLGVDVAEVLTLDVVDVDLDWPPAAHPSTTSTTSITSITSVNSFKVDTRLPKAVRGKDKALISRRINMRMQHPAYNWPQYGYPIHSHQQAPPQRPAQPTPVINSEKERENMMIRARLKGLGKSIISNSPAINGTQQSAQAVSSSQSTAKSTPGHPWTPGVPPPPPTAFATGVPRPPPPPTGVPPPPPGSGYGPAIYQTPTYGYGSSPNGPTAFYRPPSPNLGPPQHPPISQTTHIQPSPMMNRNNSAPGLSLESPATNPNRLSVASIGSAGSDGPMSGSSPTGPFPLPPSPSSMAFFGQQQQGGQQTVPPPPGSPHHMYYQYFYGFNPAGLHPASHAYNLAGLSASSPSLTGRSMTAGTTSSAGSGGFPFDSTQHSERAVPGRRPTSVILLTETNFINGGKAGSDSILQPPHFVQNQQIWASGGAGFEGPPVANQSVGGAQQLPPQAFFAHVDPPSGATVVRTLSGRRSSTPALLEKYKTMEAEIARRTSEKKSSTVDAPALPVNGTTGSGDDDADAAAPPPPASVVELANAAAREAEPGLMSQPHKPAVEAAETEVVGSMAPNHTASQRVTFAPSTEPLAETSGSAVVPSLPTTEGAAMASDPPSVERRESIQSVISAYRRRLSDPDLLSINRQPSTRFYGGIDRQMSISSASAKAYDTYDRFLHFGITGRRAETPVFESNRGTGSRVSPDGRVPFADRPESDRRASLASTIDFSTGRRRRLSDPPGGVEGLVRQASVSSSVYNYDTFDRFLRYGMTAPLPPRNPAPSGAEAEGPTGSTSSTSAARPGGPGVDSMGRLRRNGSLRREESVTSSRFDTYDRFLYQGVTGRVVGTPQPSSTLSSARRPAAATTPVGMDRAASTQTIPGIESGSAATPSDPSGSDNGLNRTSTVASLRSIRSYRRHPFRDDDEESIGPLPPAPRPFVDLDRKSSLASSLRRRLSDPDLFGSSSSLARQASVRSVFFSPSVLERQGSVSSTRTFDTFDRFLHFGVTGPQFSRGELNPAAQLAPSDPSVAGSSGGLARTSTVASVRSIQSYRRHPFRDDDEESIGPLPPAPRPFVDLDRKSSIASSLRRRLSDPDISGSAGSLARQSSVRSIYFNPASLERHGSVSSTRTFDTFDRFLHFGVTAPAGEPGLPPPMQFQAGSNNLSSLPRRPGVHQREASLVSIASVVAPSNKPPPIDTGADHAAAASDDAPTSAVGSLPPAPRPFGFLDRKISLVSPARRRTLSDPDAYLLASRQPSVVDRTDRTVVQAGATTSGNGDGFDTFDRFLRSRRGPGFSQESGPEPASRPVFDGSVDGPALPGLAPMAYNEFERELTAIAAQASKGAPVVVLDLEAVEEARRRAAVLWLAATAGLGGGITAGGAGAQGVGEAAAAAGLVTINTDQLAEVLVERRASQREARRQKSRKGKKKEEGGIEEEGGKEVEAAAVPEDDDAASFAGGDEENFTVMLSRRETERVLRLNHAGTEGPGDALDEHVREEDAAVAESATTRASEQDEEVVVVMMPTSASEVKPASETFRTDPSSITAVAPPPLTIQSHSALSSQQRSFSVSSGSSISSVTTTSATTPPRSSAASSTETRSFDIPSGAGAMALSSPSTASGSGTGGYKPVLARVRSRIRRFVQPSTTAPAHHPHHHHHHHGPPTVVTAASLQALGAAGIMSAASPAGGTAAAPSPASASRSSVSSIATPAAGAAGRHRSASTASQHSTASSAPGSLARNTPPPPMPGEEASVASAEVNAATGAGGKSAGSATSAAGSGATTGVTANGAAAGSGTTGGAKGVRKLFGFFGGGSGGQH